MIRAFLTVLLASALLASCGRHEPAPREGRPALWVIEDQNGRPAGWLFGTIHALPDGALWRTRALDRAIARAGVLMVEVRDLNPRAIAAEFDRLAHDRPGPPLAARLEPGPRRELAALLAREGAGARDYDGLETWAAALALARLGEGSRPENGVDGRLVSWFAGRPVRELEGAADQLTIFDQLPERDQRALLAAVITEEDRTATQVEALAEAWLSGDVPRMKQLVFTGMLADAALYEALLVKRDRAWVAKVLPLLRRGERPLVAVGAAHMLGPDGLPALIAHAGFTVRRVQ